MIPYVNPENVFVHSSTVPDRILTDGPIVRKFEELAAQYTGAKYAVACSSGTIALYCVYRSLGLAGKKIAMPSYTWRSTAEAALMANAEPVFVDIDPETLCIEHNNIPKSDAVVAIDCFGNPAPYDLLQLRCPGHIRLIVDSAHSFGSLYCGEKIGKYGIHCYSLSPTKVLVANEGGLITCNDASLADELRQLRRWAGRMTEYNAACAILGLKKLPEIIAEKKRIAEKYRQFFHDVGWDTQKIHAEDSSTFKDVIAILSAHADRNNLKRHLENCEIETRIYFWPCHTLGHFHADRELVHTNDVYARSICLPSWPGVDQEYVLKCLGEFAKRRQQLCQAGISQMAKSATV